MNALVAQRIRANAIKLGLPELAENITELTARAEQAQLGYLEFLDQLLEDEVGAKESRRFRNALRLSGLPHHRGLDEFDFAFQPGLDARKVKDLAGLGFIGAKSNIALLGPPGVGKTMLAVGLAVAACQAGYSIYFTTLDDLVRKLRTTEAAGRFPRQLRTYLRPSVLVVDEVGYLPLSREEVLVAVATAARLAPLVGRAGSPPRGWSTGPRRGLADPALVDGPGVSPFTSRFRGGAFWRQHVGRVLQAGVAQDGGYVGVGGEPAVSGEVSRCGHVCCGGVATVLRLRDNRPQAVFVVATVGRKTEEPAQGEHHDPGE